MRLDLQPNMGFPHGRRKRAKNHLRGTLPNVPYCGLEDLAFDFLSHECLLLLPSSPLFIFICQLLIAIGTMDSAASMVVGSALSAIFQQLLDKFGPPFLESLGFLYGVGVEKEAQKLQSSLSRIQDLLADADERQIKEKSVRSWLDELRPVALDAEDILDEVDYEVLRSKIEGATRKRKLTEQVSDLFSSSFSNLNMGPRIKEIRERLEEIESRSNHLHLKVMLESKRLGAGKRPPTSSKRDESIVLRRETDRETVVGLLTSDDSSASGSGIQVVRICRIGGPGQTRLAHLICEDERVKNYFDVRAPVCVSEDCDLMRLTKAIAQFVPGSNPHLTNLDGIKEALKEMRLLLVLDDVWNNNCNYRDALPALSMIGARGSRILAIYYTKNGNWKRKIEKRRSRAVYNKRRSRAVSSVKTAVRRSARLAAGSELAVQLGTEVDRHC